MPTFRLLIEFALLWTAVAGAVTVPYLLFDKSNTRRCTESLSAYPCYVFIIAKNAENVKLFCKYFSIISRAVGNGAPYACVKITKGDREYFRNFRKPKRQSSLFIRLFINSKALQTFTSKSTVFVLSQTTKFTLYGPRILPVITGLLDILLMQS